MEFKPRIHVPKISIDGNPIKKISPQVSPREESHLLGKTEKYRKLKLTSSDESSPKTTPRSRKLLDSSSSLMVPLHRSSSSSPPSTPSTMRRRSPRDLESQESITRKPSSPRITITSSDGEGHISSGKSSRELLTESSNQKIKESLSVSPEYVEEQQLMAQLNRDVVTKRISDENIASAAPNPMSFITQNRATSTAGRYLCSLTNVAARQFVSVFVTTYLRQVLAWTITRGTEDKPEMRWIMAGLAIAYPTVLNVIGFVTDRYIGSKMEKVVADACEHIEEILIQCATTNQLSLDPTLLKTFRSEMEQKIIDELNNNNEINSAIVNKCSKRFEGNSVVDGEAQGLEFDIFDDSSHSEEDSDISLTSRDTPSELTQKANLTEQELNHLFEQIKEQIEHEIAILKKNLDGKYWDTSASNLCRLFNVATLVALSSASGYIGTFPDLAPTLVAFGVYCILRDLIQLFLPLDDGIQKFYMIPTAFSAAAYGVNQTWVNQLMATFAKISGQSGAKFPYSEIVKNDLLRGGFNWLGEIIDLLTLIGLQSRWARQKLIAIKLVPETPSFGQLWKTWTGTHSGRTALFFILLLLSNLISSEFNAADYIANPFLSMLVMSGIDGTILMLGYLFLLALATRADWPYSSDAQTGGHVER